VRAGDAPIGAPFPEVIYRFHELPAAESGPDHEQPALDPAPSGLRPPRTPPATTARRNRASPP